MKLLKFFKSNVVIIESLIYISILIFTIYIYLSGSIILKFIPILFILGFIGNVLFKRPVITGLFSFVISLTITRLLNTVDIYNNFLNSAYIAILVILGECAGYFYLMYKDKLVVSKRKKVSNFINVTIIIIAAILLTDYSNGNLYNYIKAKNMLNQYFKAEYGYNNDVRILEEKFIRDKTNYYSFNIKIREKTYEYFVDIAKNTVIDKNIDKFAKEKLNIINNILNKKIEEKIIILPNGYNITFVNNNNTLDLNFKIVCTLNEKENLNNFLLNSNNILNKVMQIDELNKVNNLELRYTNEDSDLYTIIDNKYLLDLNRYKEAFDITVSEQ